MTFLFVDTNILLHFKRLEEIDWLTLAKSSSVTLLLAPIVMRELDDQKATNPQHKLRKRAQSVAASLNSRQSSGSFEIRQGVTVQFISDDPDIDFGKHKLRQHIDDDWLIASILDWKTQHANTDVRLVSDDSGISIKSRAHKIQLLQCDEAERLPEVIDAAEKQIQELQKELRELKNAVPKLTVDFEDGTNLKRFTLQSPLLLDENSIAQKTEEIRKAHPLVDVQPEPKGPATIIQSLEQLQKIMADAGPAAKVSSLASRENARRYNGKLEAFYSQYEAYLRELHEARNAQRRAITFSFVLANKGSSPAEDVDVHFHFPDGFELYETKEDDELPSEPVCPEPPPKIGTLGFLAGLENIRFPWVEPISFPSPYLGGIDGSLTIKKTNSYDVETSFKRLKHGYVQKLGPFLLVFNSFETAQSFRIDYSLTAGNLPRGVSGELSVIIEK